MCLPFSLLYSDYFRSCFHSHPSHHSTFHIQICYVLESRLQQSFVPTSKPLGVVFAVNDILLEVIMPLPLLLPHPYLLSGDILKLSDIPQPQHLFCIKMAALLQIPRRWQMNWNPIFSHVSRSSHISPQFSSLKATADRAPITFFSVVF